MHAKKIEQLPFAEKNKNSQAQTFSWHSPQGKELKKSMQTAGPRALLENMDKQGILADYLPEIKALQKCEQGPPYHLEGDVYTHTLLAADNLPQDASTRLKWALVFHDIAKPETRAQTIKNGKERISFHKHDRLGAKKAAPILKRLQFSEQEIKDICWLIENHQRIFQITGNISNAPSEKKRANAESKALAKITAMLSEKGKDLVADLFCLASADTKGKISEAAPGSERDIAMLENIFQQALAEFENEKSQS